MRGFRKCSNQFQLTNFCHSKYYCIFPQAHQSLPNTGFALGCSGATCPLTFPPPTHAVSFNSLIPTEYLCHFRPFTRLLDRKIFPRHIRHQKKTCLQGSAKRWAPGCVNAADQTEVVSNSSNKIHQTWERLFAEPCTSRERERERGLLPVFLPSFRWRIMEKNRRRAA